MSKLNQWKILCEQQFNFQSNLGPSDEKESLDKGYTPSNNLTKIEQAKTRLIESRGK